MRSGIAWLVVTMMACGGGNDGDAPNPVPAPSCNAAGGSTTVAMPQLAYTLADRYEEAWLGSPSVTDLDEDGVPEIIVPRGDKLIAWHADGTVVWKDTLPGRIWASPVIADVAVHSRYREVSVASRGEIAVIASDGTPFFTFPWQDEMRSLAAGDVNGDTHTDLVAVTSTPLEGNGQRDIVIAIDGYGKALEGFPPNTTGAAGCDDACYVTGGYDQNVAVGDVDGDGRSDIFATQDNAYMSLHDGTGRAFDAAPIFTGRTKFSGIRWMVDYALAQQGYANDEAVDEQAHFTNTAPAITDLDGDGVAELIALGSIQNAAQTDRERGVGLFVSHADGTRPDAWITPPLFPDYRSGLFDPDPDNNIVAVTNDIALADLDPSRPGTEIVFPGFDGMIHAVDASGATVWSTPYTARDDEWTSGVAIADLSGDGSPEIIFDTYSATGGDLVILDAGGNELYRIPLGGRGAMPVPTIADADADGDLDIVVSLKDAVDMQQSVLVYEVPGSSGNCLAWPTARGSDRRDGYLPPQ